MVARADVYYDEDGKPLPVPPYEDDADWSPPEDDASGRHNIPREQLIRLTSDQETIRASTRPGSLYTITEMTERTEDSRDWDPEPVPHPHQPAYTHGLPAGSRMSLLSSITTDYGQLIGKSYCVHADICSYFIRAFRPPSITGRPQRHSSISVLICPSTSVARRAWFSAWSASNQLLISVGHYGQFAASDCDRATAH